MQIKRYKDNPILAPNEDNDWEAVATFNASIVHDNETYHMVYRAVAREKVYFERSIELSTIGYAASRDGITFSDRRLLISPEYGWEQFGCEDPRVTKIDDKYYIFYTALSDYPHTADGIKVAVAVTKDFQEFETKKLVTPFNAKAMALFS